MLRFADAEASRLIWTDAAGREWSGIRCHMAGDVLVIDGDGQIQDAAKAWLAAGGPPAAYEAPAPTQADYGAAVQAHIEATVQARSYHDAVTCASYAASMIPAWAAEGVAFSEWRDAVWLYVYAQLAAVQTGERQQPSIDTLIAELPAITWPEATQ